MYMKLLIHKALEILAAKALSTKKFQQRNGEVVVLMYHGIVETAPVLPDWCLLQKDEFEKQIKFLTEHFNVIPLRDAVEGLKNDTIKGPTAVITFDDGYQNNYDVAFPILKAYQAPATIYIASKFIDTKSTIWTGVLQDAFSKTNLNYVTWRNKILDISSKVHKKKSMELIKSELKQEPFSVIDKETQALVDQLSEGNGFCLDANSPYRMLSSSMINEMSTSDLIEFGEVGKTDCVNEPSKRMNSFKKWRALIERKAEFFWAVGPNNYSALYLMKYKAGDIAEFLQVPLDTIKRT